MRLADETTFTFGHEVIRLRATLRAAIRLIRRHGDFEKIRNSILGGNLSVMGEVIRECSDDRVELGDRLDSAGSLSISVTVDHLMEPLVRHIHALAGIDPDAPAEPQSGEPISFADAYEKLFAIATGWLGWTPEAAYEATPSEIIAAYRGRREMLGAIFGSSEQKGEDIQRGDKEALRALNAVGDLNNLTMAA